MVTNKTQNLLVTSGAQGADPQALAVGEFAVIDSKGNINPVLTTGDEFHIVVQKQLDIPRFSDRIKASGITSVSLSPYRPKVEKEITVTFDAPIEGLDYNLIVLDHADKENLQRRQDRRSYGYRGKAGDTAENIADAYAALINKDQASAVTAESAGGVLTLTGKSTANKVDAAGLPALQHYFDVFLYQVDPSGNEVPSGEIEVATQVDFGSGTFLQVKEIEKTAQGYEGFLNKTLFPVVQYPSDLDPSKNYDLLTIEYINVYSSNSVAWGTVNDPICVVIAVESGNTGDLEAIFANFL